MTAITPTRLLRLPAVMAMTGLGRDSVYRLAREGKFPKPRKLTERSSAWREDEVLAFIDSRPAYQPATPAKLPERRARGAT